MEEIFKTIEDYPSYEVSNLGRVKSLERLAKYKDTFRSVKGKILNPYVNDRGYRVVSFGKKKIKVHQLVAVAFLNHKIDGLNKVVDHIDNNKSNNRVDNLQVISQRENVVKDSKSKVSRGVFKAGNKFAARIMINNKYKYLGVFESVKEASEAYNYELSKVLNK